MMHFDDADGPESDDDNPALDETDVDRGTRDPGEPDEPTQTPDFDARAHRLAMLTIALLGADAVFADPTGSLQKALQVYGAARAAVQTGFEAELYAQALKHVRQPRTPRPSKLTPRALAARLWKGGRLRDLEKLCKDYICARNLPRDFFAPQFKHGFSEHMASALAQHKIARAGVGRATGGRHAAIAKQKFGKKNSQ